MSGVNDKSGLITEDRRYEGIKGKHEPTSDGSTRTEYIVEIAKFKKLEFLRIYFNND